jgi:hypothetical protein
MESGEEKKSSSPPKAEEKERGDKVSLYSQRIHVAEGEGERGGGYFHVGVLINRSVATNGSSSIIFVEFNPAQKVSWWKLLCSFLCPVRGVINVSHGEDPEVRGFEKICESPLRSDFLPFLSDSITDERIIQHFGRSYNVASNNCRDFAEALMQDATGLNDFKIDDVLPYSFLETDPNK